MRRRWAEAGSSRRRNLRRLEGGRGEREWGRLLEGGGNCGGEAAGWGWSGCVGSEDGGGGMAAWWPGGALAPQDDGRAGNAPAARPRPPSFAKRRTRRLRRRVSPLLLRHESTARWMRPRLSRSAGLRCASAQPRRLHSVS